MKVLLTAAQMREAERAAIAGGAVSGLDLMERAGWGIAAAVMDRWPDLARAPHRAVVLCGPGNNGGDGFVVARLLAARGWKVAVHLLGDAGKLPADAAENFRRWRALGDVLPMDAAAMADGSAPDLLVDALFGTGLTRPLPDETRAMIAALNAGLPQWGGARAGAVVGVDCPSGLDLDSGGFPGAAEAERLRADLTVTFGFAKRGHYLAEGPEWCGRLALVPLGLPGEGDAPLPGVQADRVVLLDTLPGAFRAALAKALTAHKYGHGHALVLSGPVRRTGAARLAARAALRVGAGLVTLGGEAAALDQHAGQVTAIMLHEIDGAGALAALLAQDGRITALCLGPAMGVNAATRAMVLAALGAGRATVLDADALSVFADAPETLFAALHAGCVLTPHDGEFARLFPDLGQRLHDGAMSRTDAARAAAARAGCNVLLKGPDTVIADPSGAVTIHAAAYDRAAPWLATAGAGDVLAGLITGLLARGQHPHQAAATAAWLHVQAALRFGPGLTACDLPEMLPGVFADLGL